jgi:hypothetical protein
MSLELQVYMAIYCSCVLPYIDIELFQRRPQQILNIVLCRRWTVLLHSALLKRKVCLLQVRRSCSARF